jgi:glycerol transport system ATP-binding protein
MASVTLDNIGHAYNDKAPLEEWALKPTNLEFASGRTYAMVGPSGCGKTTMLNIISGLVSPKQGRVLFDGEDVTNQKTEKRNVAQVFQFPAIYRSMNVFDNMAFPLECRNWDSKKIENRVNEVAELLGISDKLKRAATKLGIDEKQLVSLGRGLVRDDVSVLLMDEPLTVIDPQLKLMLRKRIKQANDQFGATIIYVTHDQYEAMTFAEELIVMKDGQISQMGTPEMLFEKPADNYVGYFIGSPAMNFIDGQLINGKLVVEGSTLEVGSPLKGLLDGPVQFGVRPEYVSFGDNKKPGVSVTIENIEDHGNTRVVSGRWGKQTIRMKLPRNVAIPTQSSVTIKWPTEKGLVYVDGNLVAP